MVEFSFQGQVTLSLGFADWTTPYCGLCFCHRHRWRPLAGGKQLIDPPLEQTADLACCCYLRYKEWVQNWNAPPYDNYLSTQRPFALCTNVFNAAQHMCWYFWPAYFASMHMKYQTKIIVSYESCKLSYIYCPMTIDDNFRLFSERCYVWQISSFTLLSG